MSPRGNKPVGLIARLMMILTAALVLVGIWAGIKAANNQQAFPARGAAALPEQAARAGAAPTGAPTE